MALDLQVGRILDQRYTLGLTETQMEALLTLKADAEARLGPMREEMQDVREGLWDGTLTRSEARDRLQAGRESWRQERTALADRLEELLQPRQRALLRMAAVRAGGGKDTARPGARRPRGPGSPPMAGRRMPGGGPGGR